VAGIARAAAAVGEDEMGTIPIPARVVVAAIAVAAVVAVAVVVAAVTVTALVILIETIKEL
jgi:hypothetical protein